MKNKFLIGCISFSILVIGIEMYFYSQNNGNLIIYIQNQSDKTNSIETLIKLDNSEIISTIVFNDNPIPYKIILNKKFGNYKLSSWRKDLDLKEDIEINLFLVNWIVIDNYTNKTKIDKYIIPPLFQ